MDKCLNLQVLLYFWNVRIASIQSIRQVVYILKKTYWAASTSNNKLSLFAHLRALVVSKTTGAIQLGSESGQTRVVLSGATWCVVAILFLIVTAPKIKIL